MNEIRTNHSAQDTSEFRWPSLPDLAVIGANVLMPYLLACILLAI